MIKDADDSLAVSVFFILRQVFALSHDELAQRYLELWKNNNRLRLRLAAAMEGVYDNRAENLDGSKGFAGGGDPTIMTTLAVLEARVTELEDDNNALVKHVVCCVETIFILMESRS